jgi:hypothetical protein
MSDPTELKFYVKAGTQTLGPYPNKLIAEMAVTTLSFDDQKQAIVEGRTPDGKVVLFG